MPTSDLTGLSQPDSVLAAGVLALGAALLAFIGVMATRRQTGRHFAATHELDQIKALRERYTTCAEQLAHDDPAVRTAGAYGLGALGDDWFARAVPQKPTLTARLWRADPRRAQVEADAQHRQEVQVCIELLCAYLRSSIRASADSGPRGAIVAVLGERSRRWRSRELDFDLRAAELAGAELNRAKLSYANLRGANLSGGELILADLRDAKLSGADLSGAKLSGAKLNGANLFGANLFGANLFGADLFGADLNGADLSSADLSSADLTGVHHNKNTQWPKGFSLPAVSPLETA